MLVHRRALAGSKQVLDELREVGSAPEKAEKIEIVLGVPTIRLRFWVQEKGSM